MVRFATDPAPTLDDIWRAGHELAVHCEPCGIIAALDVQRLVETEDPSQSIDRYRFRCRQCGGLAQPIVTSAAGTDAGRSKIWPR